MIVLAAKSRETKTSADAICISSKSSAPLIPICHSRRLLLRN
jgi:hypothetical protein